MKETDEATMDDLFGVLLDILDEVREHNGKERMNPDPWCRGCGQALADEEHKRELHSQARPMKLS